MLPQCSRYRGGVKTLVVSLATAVFLPSCAQQSLTNDGYNKAEVGLAQAVEYGKVTSLRNVAIEGETTGGVILGGVAGGLLGNEIGHGAGSTAAKIGGALLGTAIGSRVQKSAGSKQGIQIEVRLDSGKGVSVVQEANPREAFNVGDRVRVYSGGGSRTRVFH